MRKALFAAAAGIAGLGAVPESATWAMVLAGVSMLGFGLRRCPARRVRFV